MEKGRMSGYPRGDIERAAAHFGIRIDQVTESHLRALPTRGAGLQRGTAAGTSNPNKVGATLGASSGAIVGAIVGGPIGAAIGAALGAKIGGDM